jgi:uncharacterized membrane protein
LLSWPPVRERACAILGENLFLGVYSLTAVVSLSLAIYGFNHSSRIVLWDLGSAGRWLANVLSPLAVVMVLLGASSGSPTAAGGEKSLAHHRGPTGIHTVTRHPLLWATGLWAVGHLAAGGHLAALLLFGGIALLSFDGMFAIDAKRARSVGAGWRAFAERSLLVPFAAIIRGTHFEGAGIGWRKPLEGLAIYGVALLSHEALFQVSARGATGT